VFVAIFFQTGKLELTRLHELQLLTCLGILYINIYYFLAQLAELIV